MFEKGKKETEHPGPPILIICPPTRRRMIVEPLGESETRLMAQRRVSEENPLYLAFLQKENQTEGYVEVVTEIQAFTFKTRKPTGEELARFEEAYEAGQCMIQVGKIKRPITIKPKERR